MRVIFWQEIINRTHLAHQRKQICVIEKEYVQSHFDVIVVFVNPAPDLASHEWTRFIQIDFVTCIHEVDGSG